MCILTQGALRERSSFNLIHQGTLMKVDAFLPRPRPYDREPLARSIDDTLADDPSARSIVVKAPDDVILSKLEWYRLGGETSERQWSDVLGVLRVQEGRLDLEYARRRAVELGVADLLERALQDARQPG